MFSLNGERKRKWNERECVWASENEWFGLRLGEVREWFLNFDSRERERRRCVAAAKYCVCVSELNKPKKYFCVCPVYALSHWCRFHIRFVRVCGLWSLGWCWCEVRRLVRGVLLLRIFWSKYLIYITYIDWHCVEFAWSSIIPKASNWAVMRGECWHKHLSKFWFTRI